MESPEKFLNQDREVSGDNEKNKVESLKDGVEKSQEIIEDLLNYIPNEKELGEQYALRMKDGSNRWALEISKKMSLRAELQELLKEINIRKRNKEKDDFSYVLMLPRKEKIDILINYITKPLGDSRGFSSEDLLKKLINLKKVVDSTWEIFKLKK